MIYIHIPYCRSFCTYCGFYSEIPTCGFSKFVDALCAEISARAGEIPRENNTLYIGGGTPSVLPPDAFRRIVSSLSSARAEGFDEFTVEVNPDDIVKGGQPYVQSLIRLGVNRISMGVQSFDDEVLRWMNRRHDALSARLAYKILRDAGIDNISIDLIFGFGGFTESAIDSALDIGADGCLPKHISAYQLSVEPESVLAEMVSDGKYAEPPDEDCSAQYELLCRRLGEAGYEHYEISNFAQHGFYARHNSAYWHHVPYIGFGPAAHSLLNLAQPYGVGDISDCCNRVKVDDKVQYQRRWNKPDVSAYIRAAETGRWDDVTEGEILTDEQIRTEKIMLALRTDKGIGREELSSLTAHSNIERLISVGSLIEVGGRIRIPENHFFVSDNIITSLI